MRVLVTGGAGFLGTHLCAALEARGDEAVVLDSYEHEAKPPTFERVEDAWAVDALIKDCTHVVHLASLAGVEKVVGRPADTMNVILTGTGNILAAARRYRLRRVVNVSTSEVYGPYAYHADEDAVTGLPPVGESPRWSYAVAKLAAEHLCRSYYDQHGLETVNLRPCNVYGPGQIGVGAVNAFTRAAANGEPLRVNGDGSQIRSWCYVDDFTRAVLAVLDTPAAAGETFNVGNPREVCTTVELARRIIEAHGEGLIEYVEMGYPDVEIRVLDTSKAERMLDWHPVTDLATGIARTLLSADAGILDARGEGTARPGASSLTGAGGLSTEGEE